MLTGEAYTKNGIRIIFFSPNMIKYLYKTMEGGKNREESSAYERDIRS